MKVKELMNIIDNIKDIKEELDVYENSVFSNKGNKEFYSATINGLKIRLEELLNMEI